MNIQDILNFNEHTLFLTAQIFDRYISNVLYKNNKFIVEENLDIVIVTSLIIASKKEEIKLYSMKDYLNLLPDKYSLKDIVKQEYDILSKFDFNLLVPNTLDFYEILSVKCKLSKIQKIKGLYFLNIILLDSNLLQIPPSLIVYSVVYLVSKSDINYVFEGFDPNYEDQGIKKSINILPILKDYKMIDNVCGFIRYIEKSLKESVYKAPYNKFNTDKFHFVSSYSNL